MILCNFDDQALHKPGAANRQDWFPSFGFKCTDFLCQVAFKNRASAQEATARDCPGVLVCTGSTTEKPFLVTSALEGSAIVFIHGWSATGRT